MKYFRYFPTINYDLDDNKQTREIVDVFRFAKIINNRALDDISLYAFYDVNDGERPDHVAKRIYGSADYYWTFFLVNQEMKNLFTDWPMSYSQLEDHVNLNYPGTALTVATSDFFDKLSIGETVKGILSTAEATVVAKDPNYGWIKVNNKTGTFQAETIQGQTNSEVVTITGETAFKNATHHYSTSDGIVPRGTAGAVAVTNEQYEIDENDKRRRIKVLKPERVEEVVQQFRDAING
tara:strand:+ start:2570 stop:3280 length:711 start_codon:yes stop_codon:yes gene_type:complete